ncbi:MAG TPA: formyltetrahydrofolate deformylase [Rhizomicrobium sp.]|jgi:formyltetrahydrofolate deformylase|nr:formyltetrahydrofolate deformylase [Rhizomicrobium sp.]
MNQLDFVLSISCPDQRGIVAEVTRFLFERNCNILDSQQFGDRANGRFFMRVHCLSEGGIGIIVLEKEFAPLAEKFDMEAQFFDSARKTRAVVLVSKFGHGLVDLLYRCRIGAIPLEVPLIVSNHRDYEDVAAAQNIPFVHLPMTRNNKAEQEALLAALLEENRIDLVVLARYMQILSDAFCRPRLGRIINIHHSFLPSFKGANPYTQAHERGVKLIGATAHYVTADLDEGPIIEQSVERVTHAQEPEDYVAVGRDIESRTLARAVKWHCEHRILLNGCKTVIFS